MTALADLICNKTIFIVEDEMLIANYVSDLLSDLGCKSVVTAHDVDTAVAELENCKPDLTLLDLKLGSVFCYPVAEALAKKNVPIIFATGFEAEALDETWAAYPVLTKPYTIDALSAALMQALQKTLRSLEAFFMRSKKGATITVAPEVCPNTPPAFPALRAFPEENHTCRRFRPDRSFPLP